MEAAETSPHDNTYSRSDVNPWLIAVVVSLAAFMEVLDTSIANVALPHIAGDLGASGDEGTWVLTSCLVARYEQERIYTPLSGRVAASPGLRCP